VRKKEEKLIWVGKVRNMWGWGVLVVVCGWVVGWGGGGVVCCGGGGVGCCFFFGVVGVWGGGGVVCFFVWGCGGVGVGLKRWGGPTTHGAFTSPREEIFRCVMENPAKTGTSPLCSEKPIK